MENKKDSRIKFHYIFKFFDSSSSSIEIYLDAHTLDCQPPPAGTEIPEWARLSFNKCPECPLDERDEEYCPIAANISGVVNSFGEISAGETAQVMVLTRQRDYSKNTTIRDGLASVLGIYMATSGCPVMGKLKPMVRYHQPFLSLDEYVYRVISMYLMVQYFLSRKGKKADWGLRKIQQIYEHIRMVNAGMSMRLRDAAQKEASLTAISSLDNMASLLPFVIDETFDEIEKSFESYMEEN